MKRTLAVLAATALSLSIFSSTSFAAGFSLPDQDAAAMGMANAFTGQADNPSAVWYNPAGITQLDGTRISGGIIGIYPVLTHENTDGTTDVAKRDIALPFVLYGTNKVSDKLFLGIGINSPFGLSTRWSDASETRYVATYSNLEMVNVNPNIAYKVNDDLSVAAGIDYVRLRATLEKMLNLSALGLGDRNFRLSGDGDGWGANAAVRYRASEKVNLGISYRSRVKIDIDGSADVSAPIPGVSNSAHTSVTLPDLAQIGVSYKASDNLTLNADIDYTWWSTYDKLVVQSNTIRTLTLGATDSSTDEKDWKDVWAIRIGGEYKVSEQWKLRAGYLYDKTPVPDSRFETRIPDADRQGVSIGAGFTSGNVTVDLAYMYVRFNTRTIDDSLADDQTPTPNALNGTYKSEVHLTGVTVGYKF